MTNKDKEINQKVLSEINRKVWLVKDKNGVVLDSCRQKMVAERSKGKLEGIRFERLFLERDNSFRNNLKEILRNE